MVDANPTAFEFVTSAQGFAFLKNPIKWRHTRVEICVQYSLYRNWRRVQPGQNWQPRGSRGWPFNRQLLGRFADDVRHGGALHDIDPFMSYSLVKKKKDGKLLPAKFKMPKSLNLGEITRSWMTPETFPYTTASLLLERYAQLKSYKINSHLLKMITHGRMW
jgi:hypothetical protein